MNKNKNTSKIILVVIVALLATFISYSAFQKMGKQIDDQNKLIELMQSTKGRSYQENFAYAIATKDLKAGEPVSDEDVDFKQYTTEDKTAFENRSDVVNKVLLKDITLGETFTSAHIAKVSSEDVALRPGYRALTLPAETFEGKASSMTAGTSVDIYSASKDSDWQLDNIKILSFEGTDAKIPTTMTTAKSITFEVGAESIADFISGASKGKMVLVVRNPNEKSVKRNSNKPPQPSFSAGAMSKLPSAPPIENLGGLPEPMTPQFLSPEVEIIEANVKSKVTFD